MPYQYRPTCSSGGQKSTCISQEDFPNNDVALFERKCG